MVSAVIKEVFDNTDKVADQMFYDDSDSMATIKTVLERGGWEWGNVVDNSETGMIGLVVKPIGDRAKREIPEIAAAINGRTNLRITPKPYFGQGVEGTEDPYAGIWILYISKKESDEYQDILNMAKSDFEQEPKPIQ